MRQKKYLCYLLFFVVLVCSFGIISCSRDTTVVITLITNNSLQLDPLVGRPGRSTNFEVPDLEDNDFEGLYTDKEFVHYFGMTIDQFPNTDITLYLKYNPFGLYRISFDSQGGTPIKSIDVFFGESLADYIPDEPFKNGNIFLGWEIQPSSKDDFVPFNFDSYMPECNLTLRAKWSRDPSKSYYKFILDNKVIKEEIIDDFQKVSAPKTVRLDSSFIFDGWYTDPLGAKEFNFDSAVAYSLQEAIDEDGAYCFYGNYYSRGLVIFDGVVCGYNGSSQNVVLPWAKDGLKVESIASEAFAGTKIKSISIPDSVTTVGRRAFYNCRELVSVELPEFTQIVHEEAFVGCSSLASVYIPKEVELQFDGLFRDCDSLVDIRVDNRHQKYMSISGSVYTADGTTLIKCASGLKSFSVADGTTVIEPEAFDSKVLKSLTICDSVKNIKNGAIRYEDCSLTELTLPAVANSTYMNNGVETEIFNLAAVFGAESYLDNMGSSIYLNSLFVPSSLISVNITSVYSELSYSFYGCFYIKNVTLPQKGLNYIGAGAFYLCYNLTEIDLPQTVTEISGGSVDNAAFYYCQNLKRISLPNLQSGYLSYIFGAPSYQDYLDIDGTVLPYTFFLEEVDLISTNIKELRDGAFYGNKSLKRISFNSQIKKLGQECFYNCSQLENIDNLEYVEELASSASGYSGAFAHCRNLEDVTLPRLSKGIIGREAFLGIGSFGASFSFTVNEGIIAIEDYAFMDCTALIDIKLPSSLMYVGSGAFYNCTALKKLTIPSSVRTIGASAFQRCVALASLEIPLLNNVEISKTDREIIPSFILSILFGARSMTENKYKSGETYSYYVPPSLKTVSFNSYNKNVNLEYSFYNCEFIESINLPNESARIGEMAFYGCLSLKSITIGDNITDIGAGAFSYCKSLDKIILGKNNSSFYIDNGAVYSFDATELIFYPAGRKNEDFKVLNSVKKIASFAFAGNAYVKTITLPLDLEYLGDSIFQNCSSLQNVICSLARLDIESINDGFLLDSSKTIMYAYFGQLCEVNVPDSVEEIRPYTFSNLKYIKRIVFGKNVSRLGEFAFMGSEAEIIFNDGLESIDNRAFYGYLNNAIKLPAGLKTIGERAFENSELTSVAIPNSVMTIDDYAFFNCSKLSELKINKGALLKTIGSAAFGFCILKAFTVSDNLYEIGSYAFAYNKIGEFDSLGTGLQKIGEYAFYLNSLQTVNISGAIKIISEGAFASNYSLYNLFIEDGVEEIGSNAFAADVSVFGYANPLCMLNNIHIPASVRLIGDKAFFGSGHYAFFSGENDLYWYVTQKVTLTFAKNSQLETIGNGAFDMVRLLDVLDLSSTRLKTIGSLAFANFVGSNHIPDTNSLKKVIFPDTLLSIGSYAFLDQIGLLEISIPSSVMEISDAAFLRCSNLAVVMIGNDLDGSSLKRIGAQCFNNVNEEAEDDLKIFIFAKEPPSLGENAFYLGSTIFVSDELMGIYSSCEDFSSYDLKVQ